MKDKAKVILTLFAFTALPAGCSTMQHMDGTPPDRVENFRTGAPTPYEKEREFVYSTLKELREREIVDARSRMWEGENYPVVGSMTSSGSDGYKPAPARMPEHERPEEVAAPASWGSPPVKAASPVEAAAPLKATSPTVSDEPPSAPSLSEPLVIAYVLGSAQAETPKKKDSGPAVSATDAMKKMRPGPAPGEPRIKIVSGDGMPLSAKKLSKELKSKGYTIDRVDVAPYIFQKRMVFYAPGFKENADTLAREIHATGGTKALTWKSVYDIIVVSLLD